MQLKYQSNHKPLGEKAENSLCPKGLVKIILIGGSSENKINSDQISYCFLFKKTPTPIHNPTG